MLADPGRTFAAGRAEADQQAFEAEPEAARLLADGLRQSRFGGPGCDATLTLPVAGEPVAVEVPTASSRPETPSRP